MKAIPLSILLSLMAFGCATKPKLKLPPMPPGIQRPVKAKALAAVAPIDFTISWDDCTKEPGTSYRIYETTNLFTWTLYAEVTNRWITILCDRPGVHMFGVRSVVDGKEGPLAGKECPP